MGRHTLTELLHILSAVVVVLLFAWLAAWAVPLAAGDIWLTAIVALLAVGYMAIRPMRLALAADRAERDSGPVEPEVL